MSETWRDRSRVILKIGGVHHAQLSKLHLLLDKCQDERLAAVAKAKYEVPRILSSKSSGEFEGYLIELEIPIGNDRNRPRSLIDALFDALGIFPEA